MSGKAGQKLTKEEVEIFKAGVAAERQRCIKILEFLIQREETKPLYILRCIESGEWPDDED